MATGIDRVALLRENQETFTGLDFVHVVDPCEQTILHLFFLTDLSELDPPFSGATKLSPSDITIASATDPNAAPIRVLGIEEDGSENQVVFDDVLKRHYIAIQVEEPGDFTQYRLTIDDTSNSAGDSRLDPYFNGIEFSFKVSCETNRDCVPAETECPLEPGVDFPVDYLARDFVSFRNALLDFASQRYPQWAFPLVPDVGTMMAEVFAALGDELSYTQDRYAREAFLETANQRRSLRKKARLLDYEIHDGMSANTLLELTIDPAKYLPMSMDFEQVAAGQTVWAPAEGRAAIAFEVGRGIHDLDAGGPTTYPVRPAWNASELVPFCYDERDTCLKVGATEMFIEGHLEDHDVLNDEEQGPRWMLLRVDPTNPGVSRRRIFVRLEKLEHLTDPLQGVDITRIVWSSQDALEFQIDQTFLSLSFNIVPATAGETFVEEFVTRPDGTTPFAFPEAVVREGPQPLHSADRPTIYLYGLKETATRGLGFLGEGLRATLPEIRVEQLEVVPGGGPLDPVETWTYLRTLLSAGPQEHAFTLEDGTWRRVRTFRRAGFELQHQDYATGDGYSLRFGDDEFGVTPAVGDLFRVSYRTGPGARANVPAGAINALFLTGSDDQPLPGKEQQLPDYVIAVTNPADVTTGVDAESERDIKLLVPEAYQADVLFAVRPEDYGEQAEKLDFVQRAQGTQRYTGSWLTTFVAADPFGSNTMTELQRDLLESWMNCVRQAGRDVVVKDPKSLPIDLEIQVCVEPFAYAGQVAAQVEAVLLGSGQGRGPKGFFHPDNFTFGTPLRRSKLEATIQRVPGVRSVRQMRIRERGQRALRDLEELVLPVDPDQVLRLDNDPQRPGNGTLRLLMEGGA